MDRGPLVRFDRTTVARSGQVLVERVSLEVRAGEALALIGRDGSGKTALVEAAATAVPLHGGDVLIDGLSARGDPAGVRRLIGFVPAHTDDWPGVRAGEFLEVFAAAAGLRGEPLAAAVGRGLKRAGLSDRPRERLTSLSRGRLRRLLVARALLHDPEVLLLDDPFAALDPTERDGLARLVEDTHLVGRAVVATIRDAAVPGCFNSLAVLAEGRLVASGPNLPETFAMGREWHYRIACPARGSDAADLVAAGGCKVVDRDADWLTFQLATNIRSLAAVVASLVEAGIPVESAGFHPPWQAQLLGGAP